MQRASPIWLILITSVALGLASCRPTPAMSEYSMHFSRSSRDIAFVPVILVGLALSDAITDEKSHRARYDDQEWIQRCEVKIAVETVLQGKVADKQVIVYFFVSRASLGNSGSLLGFNKGDRNIFFLQRDYGELRTINDTFSDQCLIPVFSGAHPSFRRDPRTPVWDSIIDLLLTRGTGTSDQEMLRAVRRADQLGQEYDQVELIKKLTQIASNDVPKVREGACAYLQRMNRPCPST